MNLAMEVINDCDITTSSYSMGENTGIMVRRSN